MANGLLNGFPARHGGTPNSWMVFVRENPNRKLGWWLGVPPCQIHHHMNDTKFVTGKREGEKPRKLASREAEGITRQLPRQKRRISMAWLSIGDVEGAPTPAAADGILWFCDEKEDGFFVWSPSTCFAQMVSIMIANMNVHRWLWMIIHDGKSV